MFKHSFVFELQSSLVHTEETSSNIANIYREKVMLGGKVHHIPALHGNSIRGTWRDLGANHLCTLLEIEPNTLPLKVFHILFSGGALDKSVAYMDVGEKRKMRQMLPFLSVFGSAIGNEMLQGKMIVGSAYPHCKELGTGDVSYNDMTALVRYTRTDDTKRVLGERDDKGDSAQMFYDTETLAKGVMLDCEVIIDSDDEIELAAFHDIIEQFKEKPYLGGTSRAGHGKVSFEHKHSGQSYRDYVAEHKEEIRDYLVSTF